MKMNVGNTEHGICIATGVVIISAGIYFKSWWGVIGLIPLATGLSELCPAYMPFGISTCKASAKKRWKQQITPEFSTGMSIY